MHAFLISDISLLPSPRIGEGDPAKREGEVPKDSNNPDVLEIHPEISIGIAEVRQVSQFLSRKPISGPTNTVIVHDAHLLTIPAQNAFLKTLEEPPPNSVIYLVTSQSELLLSTILSRIQIISDNQIIKIDPQKLENSAQLFQQLLKVGGEGERLTIIQNQNFTRQSALEFLDHLEHILHSEISPSSPYPPPPTANAVRSEIADFVLGGGAGVGVQKGLPSSLIVNFYPLVAQTRHLLKSNVNLTLALGNFALHLKAPFSD
jgi:hypothetical protein